MLKKIISGGHLSDIFWNYHLAWSSLEKLERSIKDF